MLEIVGYREYAFADTALDNKQRSYFVISESPNRRFAATCSPGPFVRSLHR
jgi:hypothetical protein